MDLAAKKALRDTILTRAAEQLGDITPHVFVRYYASCPDALDGFVAHSCGRRQQLEGEMVQQALYCLMEWYEWPGEIEIILLTTIPHHIETLHVTYEHFARLIDTVCETITDTIPAQNANELEVWLELQHEIKALCDEAVRHAVVPKPVVTGVTTP
jgi:hypothetical protein